MLTVNLHSDCLAVASRRFEENADCSALRKFRRNLFSGAVNVVFCAVGGDADFLFPPGYQETARAFHLATRLPSLCGETLLHPAFSSSDIQNAVDSQSVALVLGLEGGSPLEGRVEHLDALYDAGLRWLSPTWNLGNSLGDGCGTSAAGGLTAFGEEVIRRANKLGIVLDFSHMSAQTFEDAVAVCEAPFLVSHSNCSSLCPHPRNLPDEQIRAVARAHGVIGVSFFPRFLCADRAPVWDDIERHIRHILSVAGPSHVGLGPDFIYAREESVLEDFGRSGVDYGLRATYPDGFADDSCFRAVAESLASRGIEEGLLRKIMGENALRVVADVERLAEGAGQFVRREA